MIPATELRNVGVLRSSAPWRLSDSDLLPRITLSGDDAPPGLALDFLLEASGMTGDLKYYKDVAEEPTHARVLISFGNGYHLAFDDQRLFGKVDLIEAPDAFIEEHKLGLDPLDLDFLAFRERPEGRRGEIKATLMNQRIFAGIGNIYSDEILFQVRLHPRTGVGLMDGDALHDLHAQTQGVLHAAIERGATPQGLPDSYLLPPPAGGSGLSSGQRKDPEDEGGGPHRLLLSSLPANACKHNLMLL